MDERSFGFRTRALHAGTPPDGETGARALPVHLSTAFVFDSTEHAAELFALRTYGNIYTRIGNPTVAAFEEKLASLEGGLGCVATASGLSAQLVTILSIAQQGDHLVASANLYGGTITQFSVTLKRMGIETTFVPAGDLDGVRTAVRENTRGVFVETIGNPNGNVADLAAFAEIAHGAGVPLIVDNTFATPYLCRPIEHGADVVVHSATKFIGGHGTVMGGAIVESGTFPWAAGKHPLLATPSPGYHGLNFAETFGEYAFLQRARVEVLRDVGASISPMNAWLLVQGLETLALRMPQHVANARAVATFLRGREEVAWVSYPDLPDSPDRALAARYLPEGAGAVFTFGLRGGREAGSAFIEALELWSHLANVGDAKSLVIHPASTTHQQLTEDEMRLGGIGPETVRLSVGLEDVDDLIWDLERGLAAAERVSTGAASAEAARA
ncbi:MAG TPA: O-acetylhomoserine aminocarboxypropyltransferase/cysteine synthase family protein [Candidatus Elarobacter sp.]|jgi:O-acetylhomoserine (thiol)-lyase|nr:O-acetylhomoserine aminocarboxypropyltransferase/cysteine synthase family protein [Candidatus Elarobacter sp.]